MELYTNSPLENINQTDAQKVSPLSVSVINLPGIGEKLYETLVKFKISTIEDIIFAFPFRYEILNEFTFGEKGVLSGIYESHGIIGTKGGKRLLKAIFRATNGFISGVWLNFTGNYPVNSLKKGVLYHLYGNVTRYDGMYSVFHPEFLKDEEMGSVRPIYSLPAAISQKVYCKAVSFALKKYLSSVNEILPVHLLDKYTFPEIKDAITTIHGPQTEKNADELTMKTHPAFKRFIYQECFYFAIASILRKKNYAEEKGISFKIDKNFLNSIKEIMPFKLTNAQRRVLVEIFNDMLKDRQTNRLIQGDVGSGKTVVAFIAAAAAAQNGYQAVLIAPTEVLAEQHFRNMQKFFGNRYAVALITGSVTKKNKDEAKQQIASGSVHFVVGTHAILEEDVTFLNLGLVIIDEQHRFGVKQRKILMNKGCVPDVILMTATPIPRTLSMTIFGDLDVSSIDEMPPGRIPCITKAFSCDKLKDALDFVNSILDGGSRAYFIYPLIDESDKLEIKAATQSFEYIQKYFKTKKVALLHGRMKGVEKRDILDKFKDGHYDILVSTTVVEVGVDVPEATVMVIENAERFGLAQLHQLRGRVGRNDRQSYCILITSKEISETGRERINAMVKYTDGFKLAEIDLQIRGQGDFFGTKQSGVPEFKYADILRDINVFKSAKEDAVKIIENDQKLQSEENTLIRQELQKLARYSSYIGIG